MRLIELACTGEICTMGRRGQNGQRKAMCALCSKMIKIAKMNESALTSQLKSGKHKYC